MKVLIPKQLYTSQLYDDMAFFALLKHTFHARPEKQTRHSRFE